MFLRAQPGTEHGAVVTGKPLSGNRRETPRADTARMTWCGGPPPARRRRLDDVVRMRDLLRAEILDDLGGQRLLPSESDLMVRYSVGRNVARDVLDLLRSEGLVERVQGSGTFILNEKSRHRFDRVHSVNDSQTTSREVTAEFLTVAAVDAPRPVAVQLGLPAGAACTLLEFVTSVEGSPVAVTTSYLHRSIAKQLDRDQFSGDLYRFLESLGIAVVRAEESVEAVAAESWSAHHLGIEIGAPVLLFRRRVVDADDAVVEVGFVRFRGDRISLDVRLPRTTGEEPR